MRQSALAQAAHKQAAVIFADIDGADGVDESQLPEYFIKNAAGMIKADGSLVLNCGKEHSQNRSLLSLLQLHFVEVRACLTGGGNWVVFASKAQQDLSSSAMKAKAHSLSQQLDFILGPFFTRFDHWV